VQQEFIAPPIRLEDGRVDLALGQSVAVKGHVAPSDTPSLYLPAQIIAWRASLIEGRPRVQFVTDTSDQLYSTNPSEFVLWANAGHAYSFYVSPQYPYDEAYPNLLDEGVLVQENMLKDFTLDGPDRSVQVTGRVLDASGSPLPFSVQVRANQETGWYRSTVGYTCSEDTARNPSYCSDKSISCESGGSCLGYYRIRVPQGVRSYTLRLESRVLPKTTPADGNIPPDPTELRPVIPTVECQGLTLGLVPTQSKSGKANTLSAIQLKAIELPPFEYAQSYSLAVTSASANAAGQNGIQKQAADLAGIKVKFWTSLAMPALTGYSACVAVYEQVTTTDATGKVNVDLLPGAGTSERSYDVTIITPSSSLLASRREKVAVGSAAGALKTIALDQRYVLSGRVVDDADLPLDNVALTAEGIATEQDQARGLPPGQATARSTGDGSFSLYVDPGVYNIRLEPRKGTGLAQDSHSGIVVEKSQQGLQFTLPNGRLLRGRLQTAQGLPATDFVIKHYTVVPASNTEIKAVSSANTTTDGDGNFDLILPPVK
jgi:hypothetical protein